MSTDAGVAGDGTPEMVPARMVNAFVYCPRLFHLEWVQSRFATNDDVEEGRYVHRVVDTEAGVLPGQPGGGDGGSAGPARSVWLSSESLRVTARMDLVTSDAAGTVTPVDYKKGHPRDDGTPWPSDEVQVALQVLILRDNGFHCEAGELWYDETRRRVGVPVTQDVEATVRKTLDDVWRVARMSVPPPPLVDSPKCPRCSLVGVCLPDEINTLLARRERPARRIIPSDPDASPLYVTEQGAYVGIKGGRLEIRKDREVLSSARLIDVLHVNLYGNVSISAQALRNLFDREIPVCWFSYGGWFSGIAHGLPGKNVDLRRAQMTATPEGALAIARAMVEGKVRNCRNLLRRNSRGDVSAPVEQLNRLAAGSRVADSAPSLLGVEGTAARIYFEALPKMISQQSAIPGDVFASSGRSRRPPKDEVNALLSFVYALLVRDLTVVALATGLDPYVGVYHRPRFGRPALALDLAEEFRPLVGDSVVLQVLNNREVTSQDFLVRGAGVQLTPEGRRSVLRAYERRLAHEVTHPVFGYRISYRRVLDVQARLLAAVLVGEAPDYIPFVTR